MRIFLLFCLLAFSTTVSLSQTVFFKSDIAFRENDFHDFYSAVKVGDQHILFTANDFTLHTYNKKSGKAGWAFDLRYKEDRPVKIMDNSVLAKSGEVTIRIDLGTGKIQDTLQGLEIYTDPIFKGDVMYASGLYDGGSVFAYDLQEGKLLWNHFISDGCQVKPYYDKDAIYANMDGTQWLKISYDGKLMNCTDSASVSDDLVADSCFEDFSLITHDGYKLSEQKLMKMFGQSIYSKQVLYSAYHTFVFQELGSKVLVVGKKMKKAALINLVDVFGTPYFDLDKILQVDDTRIWISLFSEVYTYDFVSRKVVKKMDLSSWEPYSIQMDGEDYWVISRKDGQLYGIR